MANLKVGSFTLIGVLCFSVVALGDSEGMAHMPGVPFKKTYTVPSVDSGVDLLESRGFGDREPEIRMMNLMMVEGSGYEGMEMGAPKAGGVKVSTSKGKDSEKSDMQVELTASPDAARVGPNIYEFVVKNGSTGKPLAGLKPIAQVYMTSMDMGTDTPQVKEPKPGHYQLKAIFSMKGPWALKISTSRGQKIFQIDVVTVAQ